MDLVFLFLSFSVSLCFSLVLSLSLRNDCFLGCFLFVCADFIDFVVDHFDEVRQVNVSSVDPLIIKTNDRC